MYQLVVLKKIGSSLWTSGRNSPGDVIWVRSEEAARHLVESGLARWPVNEARQIKPMEPTERKSFANLMGTRSTGLQSSKEHGPGKQSSALRAALVLPKRV